MTTLEAAARLCIDHSQVRRMCRRGTIEATHTSPGNPRRGEWIITEAALAAYIEQAQAPSAGRPPRARVTETTTDER